MYVTKKSNSIFPCSYTCHNILPCIAKKQPNKQKTKTKNKTPPQKKKPNSLPKIGSD